MGSEMCIRDRVHPAYLPNKFQQYFKFDRPSSLIQQQKPPGHKFTLAQGLVIPNKSENDKTEYDKNNGKIVSLSRVINSMYVIHINVRIIGFLLTNTFGTALKISQSFFKGSEFSRT